MATEAARSFGGTGTRHGADTVSVIGEQAAVSMLAVAGLRAVIDASAARPRESLGTPAVVEVQAHGSAALGLQAVAGVRVRVAASATGLMPVGTHPRLREVPRG